MWEETGAGEPVSETELSQPPALEKPFVGFKNRNPCNVKKLGSQPPALEKPFVGGACAMDTAGSSPLSQPPALEKPFVG